MSNQKELFNESRVTFTDVELWLRSIPRLNEENRTNHVHDYIRNYEVVNKIRRAKSLEIFNHTVGIDKKNLINASLLEIISLFFAPVYKPGCNHTAHGELNRRKLRMVNTKAPTRKQNTRMPLKIAA
jgi:hypothetical protein